MSHRTPQASRHSYPQSCTKYRHVQPLSAPYLSNATSVQIVLSSYHTPRALSKPPVIFETPSSEARSEMTNALSNASIQYRLPVSWFIARGVTSCLLFPPRHELAYQHLRRPAAWLALSLAPAPAPEPAAIKRAKALRVDSLTHVGLSYHRQKA